MPRTPLAWVLLVLALLAYASIAWLWFGVVTP